MEKLCDERQKAKQHPDLLTLGRIAAKVSQKGYYQYHAQAERKPLHRLVAPLAQFHIMYQHGNAGLTKPASIED